MTISAAKLSQVLDGKAALYEDQGKGVIQAVNPRSLGYRLVSWIVDLGNYLGRNWLSNRLPLKDPDGVLRALGHIGQHQDQAEGLRDWVPESEAQVRTLADRFQRQMPAPAGKRLGLAERIAQGQSIVTMLHHTVKNERTLYQAIQRALDASYVQKELPIPPEFEITPASFSEQLSRLPQDQLALLARPVRTTPGEAEADLRGIAQRWILERNQAGFTRQLDTALAGQPAAQVDRQEAWNAFMTAQGLAGAGQLRARPADPQAFLDFIPRYLLQVRTQQIGHLLGDRDTDLVRNAQMARANEDLVVALGSDRLSGPEQEAWFKAFLRSEPASLIVQGVLDRATRQALGPAGRDDRLSEAAALLEADCTRRFEALSAHDRGQAALGAHLRAAAQASLVQVLGQDLALCAAGLAAIDRTRLEAPAKSHLKERLLVFMREAQANPQQPAQATLEARIRQEAQSPDGLALAQEAPGYLDSATAGYLAQLGGRSALGPEQQAALSAAVQRLTARGHAPTLLGNLAAELADRHQPADLPADERARRAHLNRLSRQFETRLEEMAILVSLPGLQAEAVFPTLLPQVNRTMTALAALGAAGPQKPTRTQVMDDLRTLLSQVSAQSIHADRALDNAHSLLNLDLARRRPAEPAATRPSGPPTGFALYLDNLSAGVDALRQELRPTRGWLQALSGNSAPGVSPELALLDALAKAIEQARA